MIPSPCSLMGLLGFSKGTPMKNDSLKGSRRETAALAAVSVVAVAAMCAGPAFAGTDTTFNTALARFSAFLSGSGGKVIAVISFAGGLVGLASGRFSVGQVAIPVGVGVGAGTGIPMVTSTVTGTI